LVLCSDVHIFDIHDYLLLCKEKKSMFSKQIEHEYLFIDKELYFRNQRQFGPGLLFVVIAMLCCYVDPKSGLALKTSF